MRASPVHIIIFDLLFMFNNDQFNFMTPLRPVTTLLVKLVLMLTLFISFIPHTFSQNVGIGTNVPNQKLDVSGWIKLADQNAATPPNTNAEGSIRYNSTGKTLEVNNGGTSANWVPLLTSSSAVPSGVIVMWSGSYASIPSGWALCDGTNGTPNLLDKFILGVSGTNYTASQINVTGGNNSHTLSVSELPSHNHTGTTDAASPVLTFTGTAATISHTAGFTGTAATITPTASFTGTGTTFYPTATFSGNALPGHAHSISSFVCANGTGNNCWKGGNCSGDYLTQQQTVTPSETSVSAGTPTGTVSINPFGYTPAGTVSVTGASYTPSGSVSVSSAGFTPAGTISGGSHTHTFTTTSVGAGTAIDIRPSFYRLAYIIKL